MPSNQVTPPSGRDRGSDQEGSELWFWILVIACAGLIAGSLAFDSHGGGLKGTFAIYAILGFIAPFVLGVIARVLGSLLVQREDYYDR